MQGSNKMIDINTLARLGAVRKYNADETIFNMGDPGHEMFIILKGRVSVSINSIDGSVIKLAELKDGDFFGEMSLLEDIPRSASIIALEDTYCLIIDESNFEEIIVQQPSLAIRIMKSMSARIRQLNEEIALLQSKVIDTKEEVEEKEIAEEKTSPLPLDNIIYPPGHKAYFVKAPATHEQFLFNSEVFCPVCEKKFSVKMVRSSKLRLDKIDNDQRQHFFDFEPLWYAVWICPHCYYTNFNFAFKQINQGFKKHIIELGQKLKSKVKIDFNSPITIDEVFTRYYMLLQTINLGKVDPGAAAKAWLRISWLYSDVGDNDMYLYASQQALEFYRQFYFNARRETSMEQDQRLTLLLGELYLRLGQKEEALRFFRSSIIRKGGNNSLNQQAEDRIQELREELLTDNPPA